MAASASSASSSSGSGAPSSNATMSAVLCTAYGHASPSVFSLGTLPMPALQPSQTHSVLIRVHCAAVNPADLKVSSGMLSTFVRKTFPFVPGLDVAGVVMAVGAEVKRFAVGDAVVGDLGLAQGAFAEYAVAQEDNLLKLPAGVTYWQAAALPVAVLTAYQGLQHAGVKAGSKVLILGAAGGIGSLAVQIAKLLGATVFASASTRNLPLVRALGADRVFDRTAKDGEPHWWEALTGADSKVDAIFDTVGEVNSWEHSKLVLKDSGGILVQIALQEAPNSIGKFMWVAMGRKLNSWFSNHKYFFFSADSGAKAITDNVGKCVEWVAEGKLKVVVDSVYKLDATGALNIFEQLEKGTARGKLLLQVIPENIPREAFADAIAATAPATASAAVSAP